MQSYSGSAWIFFAAPTAAFRQTHRIMHKYSGKKLLNPCIDKSKFIE